MTKAIIFGDSLLRGVTWDNRQARYKLWDNPFPARLQKLGVEVDNRSLFGCTAPRGETLLHKTLDKGLKAEIAFLEYGGNDSDFHWPEVAARPKEHHDPLTPLPAFKDCYRRLITLLREAGIEPVCCLLPPIDAEKYFAWFSRELDTTALQEWLGDIRNIYRHQELYSLTVGALAREQSCRIMDLRAPLLFCHDFGELICEDGLHPNPAAYELMWKQIEFFFRTSQNQMQAPV